MDECKPLGGGGGWGGVVGYFQDMSAAIENSGTITRITEWSAW